MVQVIEKDSHNGENHVTKGVATVTNMLKEEHMQVNLFDLKENNYFHLKPPISNTAIKTYWVLNGMIEDLHTKRLYGLGSLIVLKSNHEVFHISTLKDTQILVHSLDDKSFEKAASGFEFIFNLLKEIQNKDATLDHSERVYQLARKVGLRVGYTGQRYLNFISAAKYHDVGKIAIPDSVLNKPEKLTEDEYDLMKTHVLESKIVLDQHFNAEVYQIASQHHERLDGSGYPLGLIGTEICEEAKIIGICDSYDAMTSSRVYKSAKSHEEAIEELRALSPSKYDLELVNLVIDVLAN